MANTYTLLETITVGAAGASSVTFNSIPQTGYTDLVMKISARSANASNFDNPRLTINSSTSTFTRKEIYAESGTVGSESVADRIIGVVPAANATASTFGSLDFYLPNYTSSNFKSYSVDSVTENNSTTQASWLLAGLWSTTTAISNIAISLQSGGNFTQYSTFSLYGVSALGVTPTKAPKATGGSIIQTDGTYWYHAFLSSGTFTPATALSCDVLVVAGGGAGGFGSNTKGAGGGGAGGYRSTTAMSLSSATTVTVGAGGAAGAGVNGEGTSGSNSVFSSITSNGGGYGAGRYNPTAGGLAGASGGSGGGGNANFGVGGAGNTPSTSPAQGFTGGTGFGDGANNGGGGGGGGATAVGATASSAVGGVGGAGSNALSSWLSTTGLGVSGYVAGGGGGGTQTTGSAGGAGGAGGGGAGGGSGASVDGTANTGGGGGGARGNSDLQGGNGGSGLVIIRYLAA